MRATPRASGARRKSRRESERAGELGAALEGSPPRGAYDLRDPRHFPPMPAHAAQTTAHAADE